MNNMLRMNSLSVTEPVCSETKIPIIKYLEALLKRLLISILFIGFMSANLFAQNQHEVSGVVTDAETGETLPNVTILVQGTSIGTSSDLDGEYSLSVPDPDGTLQFTFVGYEMQVIPIEGRTEINVEMDRAVITGGEVVVGYSTQDRRDITGSISVVDMENFKKQSVSGDLVTRGLQGRVSGVSVLSSGQPGEAPDVRIRGINTFGNNSPLYVVDGVPSSNINDINSSDIASVQVLKDAASASIYGSRAANGVIVVTTNKGGGGVEVNYSGSMGFDVPHQDNPWETLSPIEQAELRWMAIENSGGDPTPDAQYGSGSEPRLPDYIHPDGAMEGEIDLDDYFVNPDYTSSGELNNFNRINRANKDGTDWFNEIFSPAATMNHELSVNGGSELGNFMFSVNYLDQEGALMNTFRKRYGVRANTSFNLGENIRIGENLSYTVSQNPQVEALTEGSAIGHAYRQQQIIPVRDIMGNFAGSFGSNLGNAYNPVAIMDRTRNNDSSNERLFGNAFIEIEFLDNFQFNTLFGGEIFTGSSRSFAFPTYENAENTPTNSFTATSYEGRNYTWSNTLQYINSIGAHAVEFLIGSEVYKNWGSNVGGTTQGYFSFNPDFTNLNTGSGTQTNFNSFYEDGLVSGFAKLDYRYDDRYIMSATIRRDGSSRFLNEQWGWFPAGSIGWRISNEEFMSDISWISDLRFIFGYGVMGNQINVDPNNPYTLFAGDPSSTYYSIDGSNTGTALGFSQTRIGNPDARWESNVNGNVGFNGTFFNDRLEVSAEYYWKDVRDLLYAPSLPGTAGSATVPTVNVANMDNSGIDIMISNIGSIGTDIQYNASFTLTSYKNEISAIADGITYFSQESRRFDGINFIRNEVGQSVSSFYGYQIEGFWQNQGEIDDANANSDSEIYQTEAAPGRFRYADINGDGQIDSDDRTFLGDPNPDFTYGINLGMNFRNWDVSMFLYGSQGNDIWNQVKWWTDFFPNFQGAKSQTALYDSWTPDNPNATAPIQENEGSFSSNAVPNSYYVEDGSYLRLKNLQLGYTLPLSLTSQIGVSNLRVFVQGNNLLTFTGYSGLDPEVGFYTGSGAGGGSTNFGIDEGQYPTFRQYLLGVNIAFN